MMLTNLDHQRRVHLCVHGVHVVLRRISGPHLRIESRKLVGEWAGGIAGTRGKYVFMTH